ncbi:MAG: class I SAM-dependent methyltransferase [Rhodospirillales bacterium]
MASREPPKKPAAGIGATLLGIAGQSQPVAPDFARLQRELGLSKPAPAAPSAAAPPPPAPPKPVADPRFAAFVAHTIAECRRQIAAAPHDAALHLKLAGALRMQGDMAGAIAAAQASLAIDGNDSARFFLAQAGAVAPPPRTPDSVVASLFDQYAAGFEQHLVGGLRYRAPDLVAAAVRDARGPDAPPCDVMDAGCGTGLAGPLLRPFARRLDGVDLSANMVAKARDKGLYDDLVVGELVAALAARPAAYDVIVACDVLVYFGDLGPLFAAARAALRPGGLFAFTAERGAGTTFALLPEGRYAHPPAYVAATAQAAGLAVRQSGEAALRTEAGKDVTGLIYVCAAA